MGIAVLARGRLVSALGGAVALQAAQHGPAGLVLLRAQETSETEGPLPLPTLACARAARQLRAAGHPARASWRLVRCEVSSLEAARSAMEIISMACIAPVLAVSMPRGEDVDRLLAECDLVVVGADSPAAAAALSPARASLAGVCGEVTALELEPAGIATVLPIAGIGIPPAWRQALEQISAIDH